MCGRTAGSSRSACRLVPEPETSTAMRASMAGRYHASDGPEPGSQTRT